MEVGVVDAQVACITFIWETRVPKTEKLIAAFWKLTIIFLKLIHIIVAMWRYCENFINYSIGFKTSLNVIWGFVDLPNINIHQVVWPHKILNILIKIKNNDLTQYQISCPTCIVATVCNLFIFYSTETWLEVMAQACAYFTTFGESVLWDFCCHWSPAFFTLPVCLSFPRDDDVALACWAAALLG